MNLKEMLLMNGINELHMICAEAGYETDDTPGIMAEKAAAYLLKPEVMRLKMRVFHDDDMAFMRLAASKGEVIPSISNYDCADRILTAHYGFIIGREMTFTVPDDVKTAFRTIDTEAFNKQRQSYSWIYDCLKLVPYLYGIMARTDFNTLYQKHGKETCENVLKMTDSLLEYNHCPVHANGNKLVRNGLEESGMKERLEQIHEGTIPAYPSYQEIKILIQQRYPAKDKAWIRLNRSLMHILKDTEKTNYILETLWVLIASGSTYSQINHSIKEDGFDFDQNAEWKDLLTGCWYTTRMMLCNGSTPEEVYLNPAEIFLH